MKKIKLLLLLISLPMLSFAQEKIKTIRVNEAYMNGGFVKSRADQLSVNSLSKLTGETSLLLPTNDQNAFWYNSGTGNFNLGVGFQFRNKEKTGYREYLQFRTGLSYRGYNATARSSYQSETFPFDTLVSQQTGQEYYIDSTETRTRTILHSFDMLSLDASLIFRSHPQGRWSLYGGIGAKFGVSTFAQTQISNRTYSNTISHSQSSYGASYGYYGNNGENTTETFNNKANTELFIYIPVGVDFRIANNNNFFNKVHLTMDFTTNYRNINYSNLASQSLVGFGMNFGAYMSF